MPDKETIFNLFYYSTFGLITEVGVVAHELAGSDEDKMKFLHDNVERDFSRAIKWPIPENIKVKKDGVIQNGIDHTSFREYSSTGHSYLIFEQIFQYYNAPQNPLMIITPVKNGEIFVQGTETNKIPSTPFPTHIHIDMQDDWFKGYIDQEGVHLDRLINDDFFAAIKLLFNAKHYVSSMKLLMICIDTMAYLEYGDVQKNFTMWLATYAELDKIDITPEELWEFRNSILHMTNLDSKKVKSNKVTRLNFYVAHPQFEGVKVSDEGKHFNFYVLLQITGVAIAKWTNTFNIEKDKFEIFVERYDRIISDKRMTLKHHTNRFDIDDSDTKI